MEPTVAPLTKDELAVLATRHSPDSMEYISSIKDPNLISLYHQEAKDTEFQNAVGTSSSYGSAQCHWVDYPDGDTIDSVVTIIYGDMENELTLSIDLTSYQGLDRLVSAIKNNIEGQYFNIFGNGIEVTYNNKLVFSVASDENVLVVRLSGDSLQVFVDYLQHFYAYQKQNKKI